MSASITIKSVSWDHPDAVHLRDAQQIEIGDVKPPLVGTPSTAANVPVFVVAYKGDEAVGCGGLRLLTEEGLEGQADIKRMYVVPSVRGAGGSVARMILEALEQAAREKGWVALRAGTSKSMVHARAFYERFGYERWGETQHEVISVKRL